MLNVTKISSFLNSYKAPVRKIPVLTWSRKRVSKADREKFGVKEGQTLTMYFNMYTTKTSNCLEDVLSMEDIDNNNYILIQKKQQNEIRYFMEYIPSLEGVVISRLEINSSPVILNKEDTQAIASRQKRTWDLQKCIFMSKDKEAVYKEYSWVYDNASRRYSWTESGDYLLFERVSSAAPFKIDGIPKDYCGVNDESWSELSKPLLEMFPQFCNVGGNRVVDITLCSGNFLEFSRYKEPKKRITKTQKKVNDLISLPLKTISYKECFEDKIAFIERISNDMCVLRTMIKDTTNKVMIDTARIYVSKKEAIACRPDNTGNWIPMMMKSTAKHWDFTLYEFKEEDVKGTKLEYFGSIVEKVPAKEQGKLIWSLLTYPFIEQLAKAGFEKLVLDVVSNTSYQKMSIPFQQLFGNIDINKKSLTDVLGVNKYQLKRIAESMNNECNLETEEEKDHVYFESFWCPLNLIKRALSIDFGLTDNFYCNRKNYGIYDISYMDNNSFDCLLNSMEEAHKIFRRKSVYSSIYYDYYIRHSFLVVLSLLNDTYNFQTMRNMITSIVKIIPETVDKTTYYGTASECALQVYKDYLVMVRQLDDTTHFRAKFDSENLSTISAMHDLAVEVFNCKRNAINAEKFTEVTTKCSKWIFEDDTYTVIVPSSPEAVAEEGINLHHCVGSYVGRILQEITNILFIRKKDAPHDSFFTVEITNDAKIQQIHGFANRNSNTEPGLDDFIQKWVKEKKLKTSNFNKIR